MTFEVNDATARMVEAFKKRDGQEALANIALMWADWYEMKQQCDSSDDEIGEMSMSGIYLLTQFVKNINM